jgi:hypothetical protein
MPSGCWTLTTQTLSHFENNLAGAIKATKA